MRTHESANHPSTRPSDPQLSTETVALVDATADVLEFLESTLDGQSYTVLLLDSRRHAHAEIKRLRPRLVIVCTRFDRLDSLQLLTMLALDSTTRKIPVVNVMVCEDGEEGDDRAEVLGVPVSAFAAPS